MLVLEQWEFGLMMPQWALVWPIVSFSQTITSTLNTSDTYLLFGWSMDSIMEEEHTQLAWEGTFQSPCMSS